MKIILFGSSGMVGQGVLRECLLDSDVESVLAIVRNPTGQRHAKLRELAHEDFSDFSSIENQLAGYDACFYCIGISVVGMSEADYRRVTRDFTLAAARPMAKLNPKMAFVFVSGAGTGGKAMWARVKGETEQALLKLPFKSVYCFRPGYIQPLHGIKSRTKLYRALYAVTAPLYPFFNVFLSNYLTTTEKIGRAMLAAAKSGAPQPILEIKDINTLAG